LFTINFSIPHKKEWLEDIFLPFFHPKEEDVLEYIATRLFGLEYPVLKLDKSKLKRKGTH